MCLWSHAAEGRSLNSCSQSLPLLSSSAPCPRNEQRDEPYREENEDLQGAFSPSVSRRLSDYPAKRGRACSVVSGSSNAQAAAAMAAAATAREAGWPSDSKKRGT
ncbi:unnamed protein product [Pleuronectes platessa]|uniref:Uncharacterized protein n=1 Tax=Pleuronectes platessa TaxID=8262 RepID=A0A9N7THI5_PLEPL|nr:unnamed protein product [Pleuronectes platessa]